MQQPTVGWWRSRGWIAAVILCGLTSACGPADEPASRSAPPRTRPPKPPAAPRKPPSYAMLDRIGWLAGSWVGEEEGRRYEEHWLPAAGGMMLGIHREVSDAGLGSFEYVRIQGLPSGANLFASRGGVEPTMFPLVASDDRSISFENPNNPFPSKITYWIEDDQLHVQYDGGVQSNVDFKQWVFHRSDRGIDALKPDGDDGGGS